MPQPHPASSDAAKLWTWVGLLTLASVGFSFALACAVPLAAFGALAARMNARDGAALVILVWLVNQVVGYAWLGYPTDPDTLLWGLALGLSGVAALLAARAAARTGGSAAAAVGFAAAFVGYEATLYLAHFALGGGTEAYAPMVVAQILATNALAFAGLIGAHALAVRAGLVGRPRAGFALG